MISVTIGGERRLFNDVDPQWVTRLIDGCSRNGLAVCVMVEIDVPGAKLVLATSSCGSGGGGGRRALTTTESQVIAAWRMLNLGEASFTAGNVVAFLQRLRHLL